MAAKDIWNPGETTAEGDTSRITIAANATLRNVSAGRSTMTAMNITVIISQARCVATPAPDMTR